MSKAVMISINPPHTDNIFSGAKTLEWRKKPLPIGKHYVYETKKGGGEGKVIGEFDVFAIVWYAVGNYIDDEEIKAGCVSREYVEKYRGNGKIAANWIRNVKKYDKPKELSDFCNGSSYLTIGEIGKFTYAGMTRPPQSWCYVEELK